MGPKTAWHERITSHAIFTNLSKPSAPDATTKDLLATSSSEIFLASNDCIRYTNVSTMDDYIELDIPDINFSINSIKLNKSRSLLVIAGFTRVLTIFPPRSSQQLRRPIKSYDLGRDLLSSSSVLQVEVHPNCAANTSVVVLTADGYLRLFEIGVSFEHAEATVDLLGNSARMSRASFTFGDVEDMEPSCFCFGAGGDGWSAFTIFTLMRNGDVFATCPMLPRTCHITDEDAEAFLAHVVEVGQQFSGCVVRMAKAMERGTRGPLGITFLRPAKLPAPVLLGPLLLTPAPLEFSTTDVNATGICFLACQPLNVLAIAYDGKVDVCVLSQSIRPDVSRPISISVHESILLTGVKMPTLLNNSLSATKSSFFISHSDGIHEVEAKHWLHDISQSFESHSDSRIQDAATDDISSEVIVLLDSQHIGLCGCAMLEGNLDQFLLCLSTDNSLHLLALNKLSDQLDETESSSPDLVEDADTTLAPKYQSLLTIPSYRPPILSRGPKILVPAGRSHKKIVSDIETLQFMAKFVLQARKELEGLMSSFITMHRRLTLQNKEYLRQQAKLVSMQAPIDKFSTHSATRVGVLKERQDALELRFARISQELLNNHTPRLTNVERRYFQELERVKTSLTGPRGLIARATMTQNQYKQLATVITPTTEGLMSSTNREGRLESPLRTTQLGKIKENIKYNGELLDKTKNKLERLSRLAATAAD